MRNEADEFESRKRDHIRFALDFAHQAGGLSGLASVRLVHEALPELDFEAVSLATPCLGTRLSTPFYVAGMTAGHPDAPAINRVLARACAARGWAMGVGSQRRELEAVAAGRLEECGRLDGWAELRSELPDLMLLANLGLAQIIGAPVSAVRQVVEAAGARALVVHLNALQEVIQPEGTPRFSGGLEAIRRLTGELSVPVLVKETGCGMSPGTLARLARCGLAAVDVSGLGGTHWGRIEGARAQAESVQALAAETFADWGEPTVETVLAAAEAFRHAGPESPEVPEVWASGGVRTGLDAAKLIALGAHRVGYAQPALAAALQEISNGAPGALERWMERQEFELKVALFCTGSGSPALLRGKEGVWKKKPS